MDIKNTSLTYQQALDTFDALHVAIAAMSRAYNTVAKNDAKLAANLWSDVTGPAIDLCLSVTGQLLDEAARISGVSGDEKFRNAVNELCNTEAEA
jgi:hypothetical protein